MFYVVICFARAVIAIQPRLKREREREREREKERERDEPRHEKSNILHMRKQRRRLTDQRLCFRYIYPVKKVLHRWVFGLILS